MTTKAIEVLCTRWAKLADGGVSIGLRIHFDDASAIADMKPNRRYAASFVEIGDDEQPVPQPEQEESQAQDSAPADTRTTVQPQAHLTRQAAIACTKPLFRLFLEKNYRKFIPEGCYVNTEKDAAAIVCYECEVISRKEILPGTPAAAKWNQLYSRYIAWKEVPDLVS